MRLLNTQTLQFGDFYESNLPIYTILSHRWDPVETKYQDFQNDTGRSSPAGQKILRACRLAAERGHKWIWADTCCIDKTSSAELSEAINSMYRWYRKAVECYAYLNDVEDDGSIGSLQNSLWFTRGWTLQELLAPHKVLFVNRKWEIIGNKQSLAATISGITGIEEIYLTQSELIHQASIATRMSWASRRSTSILEDRAYSLLGIFGVNMPMIYGEGNKAFRRLQLEILKISNDESMWAWQDPQLPNEAHGMLAAKPDYFASSGAFKKRTTRVDRPPFRMTHKGLKLRVPSSLIAGTARVVMPIDCTRKDDDTPAAIVLYKIPNGGWARHECGQMIEAPQGELWHRHDCALPNGATIYVPETTI